MIDTLRRLFFISHVLPLLLIVPVMGIALVYSLETGVLLPNLTTDLQGEASLMSELARERPAIWTDRNEAIAFVERVRQDVSARVMILDREGRLMASSDPTDETAAGQVLSHPWLADALAGQVSVRADYSRRLRSDVADVFLPVRGPDQQVLGVIRVSQRFENVQQRFVHLRYLVFGILVVGLALGASISLLLATNLERPLGDVTGAIQSLASGQASAAIPERGPLEIRRLLHAVNTLLNRLNELERSQRHMLANIVHELGRPMGGLRSAVQALARGAFGDASLRDELLAGMDDEMERLQHLLDDLARLHDQVFGVLRIERRPIDLDAWLSRVLVPWREAAQAKGLRWTVNVAAGLPKLEADPDRLASAIGNLLSNAVKYTSAGGAVTVDVGQDRDRVRIRVSDTGPGIPLSERDRIFTAFYRGAATGRFPQGMGLGLNLARQMIVAHGGAIELDSTEGAGSRFTIWLPLPDPTLPAK